MKAKEGHGAVKISVSDLPEFDITEHLEDDKAIAEYLTVVLEANDPALLAVALGDVARSRGDKVR
jgi:probable addiction module antidote protein